MPHPRQWNRLRRLPAAELRRLADLNLARYVREELYPFSAHYRRVMDAAGVAPRDMRGVADLRRLPFTTKQDLLAIQSDPERKLDLVLRPSPATIKAHWPFARKLGLVLGGQRARDLVAFQYTPNFLTFTTGRSSAPVAFAYTPHDLEVLGEATARMFDLAAITDASERVVNLFPFAPHLAFWALTLGGFQTGRLVVPTGGGKVMGTDGSLRLMERIKPTALVGTPGFVYNLVRTGAGNGFDFSSVHTIVLGAEKVTPGLRSKMCEYLVRGGAREVQILGTYGFTEARMAFTEAPTGDGSSTGYYVHPDLGVFEVIDPKTGEPVAEGESGELVYTGTSGHGTVVVRYRTGDLAEGGITWAPHASVDCTLPRISSSLKRVSEQHALNLTKVKGTLVDLAVMGQVLSDERDIEEWQVVLSKKDDDPYGLDLIELRIAPRAGADGPGLDRRMREKLLAACEVSPNAVHLHSVDEMLGFLGMESQMKEQRFLDKRPKE
ncbi:MAG TPA: AMP-binding protein [Planctomycetota bacterium]|nr:AMP-binding protein [Planctomycetota bacterium]